MLLGIPAPIGRDPLYFLMNITTREIVQAGENGQPLQGKRFELVSPQTFVRNHWHCKISALPSAWIFGRKLIDFKREFACIIFRLSCAILSSLILSRRCALLLVCSDPRQRAPRLRPHRRADPHAPPLPSPGASSSCSSWGSRCPPSCWSSARPSRRCRTSPAPRTAPPLGRSRRPRPILFIEECGPSWSRGHPSRLSRPRHLAWARYRIRRESPAGCSGRAARRSGGSHTHLRRWSSPLRHRPHDGRVGAR